MIEQCKWLGDGTGQVTDHPNGVAGAKLPLRYCRLPESPAHCTDAEQVAGWRFCGTCPDREVHQRQPLETPIVRNLAYHVWPRKHGGRLWRRAVQELVKRAWHFNGRKLVAIATSPDADAPEAVMDLMGPNFEYLITPNDQAHLDAAMLVPMLDQLSCRAGPEQITLFAHAKGVTHAADDTVHAWGRLALSICLDYPTLVNEALETHSAAGPFKVTGKRFYNSSCGWHYAGSFYWLRNRDLFARDWRRRELTLETYPGEHFRAEEAACLFRDAQDVNLYDPKHWGRVSRDFKAWKGTA